LCDKSKISDNLPVEDGMSALITDEMRKYIKLLLKKQRQLCWENIEYDINSRYDVDELSIINAPEPNV